MIQQADALMYQTKVAGRNRVKVDAVMVARPALV
jgi:PleD family two-component response regulator